MDDRVDNFQENKASPIGEFFTDAADHAKPKRPSTKRSAEVEFSLDDLVNLTLVFCETLGTPMAMRLWYIAETRDWPKLYELRLEPGFTREDVLVSQFLKKFPFKHPDLNPTQKAVEAFLLSEDICRATNEKFSGPPTAVKHQGIIWRASQIAAKILVPFSAHAYERHLLTKEGLLEMAAELGYAGQKATVGNHGENWASLIGNLSRWTVYDAAFDHPTEVGQSAKVLLCALYDMVGIRDADVVRVGGSKVAFVPKTGQVDRSICIEPSVNLFFQLGLGRYIRHQLLRVGIDLRDQSRNQKLAVIGARTGSYATLDLSMASDTISYKLAQSILPPDWMDVLDLVRTPVGFMPDGKRVEFEKLSSMGNGFTFPVETLIFYSLAKACAEVEKANGKVIAYGDDIIVPTKVYSLLCEVLHECGFSVNEAKSYSTGPYRESCGVYAYGTQEIIPVRIAELPQSVPGLYRICNAVLAEAHASSSFVSFNVRYRRLYKSILFKVPKKERLLGPIVLQDGAAGVKRLRVHDSFIMDPKCVVSKPKQESGWVETHTVNCWLRESATVDLRRWESSCVERTMLYRLHKRVGLSSFSQKEFEHRNPYAWKLGRAVVDVVIRRQSPVSFAPRACRKVTLPASTPGPWKTGRVRLALATLADGIGWV